MSTKLTAKLSDGREMKVVSTGDTLPDGTTHFMLKPLKPSPPKEVWVVMTKYGKKEVHTSEQNATYYKNALDPTDEGKVHRYVLAEEPKEKLQPREYWQVRYKRGPNLLYHTADSLDGAQQIVRLDSNAAFQQFEIVHVREVLP